MRGRPGPDRRGRGAVDQTVGSSTSQKTGVAPAWITPSAEAMKVWPGTITSSPGPMPDARRSTPSAAVPDATPTQCRAPVGGELALEARDLLAENEAAPADDARERATQLRRHRGMLAAERDQRDLLGARVFRPAHDVLLDPLPRARPRPASVT